MSLNYAVALRVVNLRLRVFFPSEQRAEVQDKFIAKIWALISGNWIWGPKQRNQFFHDCLCHGLGSCDLQWCADYKFGEVAREYKNICLYPPIFDLVTGEGCLRQFCWNKFLRWLFALVISVSSLLWITTDTSNSFNHSPRCSFSYLATRNVA